MTDNDWAQTTEIDPKDLPEAMTTYLVAHQARDLDAATPFYLEDAIVEDDGNTYRGVDAIREWMATSASEYTYTNELVSAAKCDDNRYVAYHHLEGNFPGGVADLGYYFTLENGRIARLSIH